MQNPFRNRPQDDFGRRDHDDDRDRLRAEDWRQEEGRSWRNDRDDRPWSSHSGYERDEGYRGRLHGHGRNEGGRYGQGGQADYADRSGRRSSDRDQDRVGPAAYDTRDDLRGWADHSRSDRMGQGRNSETHRAGPYPDHGYAPGAQIWEDRDPDRLASRSDPRHHDFEPDYLHWREQQMTNLDRDYSAWRDERRQKFSSDFDSWRQARAGRDATPADNSKVGDITDGEAHSPVVKTKS